MGKKRCKLVLSVQRGFSESDNGRVSSSNFDYTLSAGYGHGAAQEILCPIFMILDTLDTLQLTQEKEKKAQQLRVLLIVSKNISQSDEPSLDNMTRLLWPIIVYKNLTPPCNLFMYSGGVLRLRSYSIRVAALQVMTDKSAQCYQNCLFCMTVIYPHSFMTS